ncbi:MAG: translation elongation factor Ts [Alphaproteobacteria bacterium]|nr:translation elongation factor Ts [Alphaproteobacteria bacterium]
MGAADIKTLRERTGAGILDCKKALAESGDDLEKAIDWLRAKGISNAAKKSARAATEGLVVSYIHAGGKIGVLLEVNCETDFVAINDNFKALCNDIAMHIAAAAPEYVQREDVPADAIEREKEIQKARVIEEGKPAAVAERIVEGRMGKFYEESCLLEQKFIKDDSKTVKDVLTDAVAKIGENIKVRRFARYVLGEGLEKKSADFAAEVAAQLGN